MSSKGETTSARDGAQKQRRKPLWRQVVDEIDTRVTPAANSLVRTNLFADTVAAATRLETRARRRLERQSTQWLHMWNLPTASDVRRMRSQLAAVEARLRDISERLEDQQLEAERRAASTAAARAAKRTKRQT